MPELIWDGKYGKDGKQVPLLRVPLPFQTIETVNESVQERQRTFDLFGRGQASGWRNRLIWGDKKYVLPTLADELGGSVNLIYIDPPFATGDDFTLSVQVPTYGKSERSETGVFIKEPSLIEQKAYRDTWGVTSEARRRGVTNLDRYLQWFSETATLLYELLSPVGTLYVHLDWHVSHAVKVLLDAIFGPQGFRNEIIWKRSDAHSDVTQGAQDFGRIHDVIFRYTKSDRAVFNVQYSSLSDSTADSWYRNVEEETGRRYNKADLTARKPGGDTLYEWKGKRPPPGRYWAYSRKKMEEFEVQERLVYSASGMPYMKRYLDESRGVPLQDLWTDISMLRGISSNAERTGYPTQKPLALLRRLIEVSSNEGDTVLDCFAGAGTTAVAAEELHRRWVVADLSRFAIHTTRKRMLSLPDLTPFVVQNLGKYERQLWQASEFGVNAQERVSAYREFILGLYHAEPVQGYTWIHGVKGGRMVYVGTVDSPVTTGDVTQIASEFRRSMGTGKDAPSARSVDVLGWDFAFELNEVAKQEAAKAGIEMRFVRIPREVLDKRAVDQGDIRFFELAALSVDVTNKKRSISIRLTDFVIPLDDVPADVQKAISNWRQWIDYWAVDWDNKADTFHNEWQAFRAKNSDELEISASHTYDQAGQHRVVVKVIDILGNDTTKTIVVDVP